MHVHFTAIGLVMIAVAVIVGAGVASYNSSVGAVYGGALDRSSVGEGAPLTEANLDVVRGFAREGVMWSQVARNDAHMWAAGLLVFGVVLVAYHRFMFRRYR